MAHKSKEAELAYQRAYRASRKEERAAYNRAYHAANKEKWAASSRAYRAAHKEERAAYDCAYRKANKEEKAAYDRAYRKANRETVNAQSRAYAEALGPRGRFAALLHKKYGLSFEAWTEMLIGQAGRCAICLSPMSGIKEPHTDHAHKGGIVRELLCTGCNTKLHALEEWPHREAALAYLDRHKARPLRIVRE